MSEIIEIVENPLVQVWIFICLILVCLSAILYLIFVVKRQINTHNKKYKNAIIFKEVRRIRLTSFHEIKQTGWEINHILKEDMDPKYEISRLFFPVIPPSSIKYEEMFGLPGLPFYMIKDNYLIEYRQEK